MMGIALVIMTLWSLSLVVFLVAWMRWQNRMERLDAAMEEALKADGEGRKIVSAGDRPYPE